MYHHSLRLSKNEKQSCLASAIGMVLVVCIIHVIFQSFFLSFAIQCISDSKWFLSFDALHNVDGVAVQSDPRSFIVRKTADEVFAM
jgi:hypothetical protein